MVVQSEPDLKVQWLLNNIFQHSYLFYRMQLYKQYRSLFYLFYEMLNLADINFEVLRYYSIPIHIKAIVPLIQHIKDCTNVEAYVASV